MFSIAVLAAAILFGSSQYKGYESHSLVVEEVSATEECEKKAPCEDITFDHDLPRGKK